MAQRKRPRQTPKVEDESAGDPSEQHGKQREQDEGLAGMGSTRGGMHGGAGGGMQGRQQNRSTLGRLQNRSTLRPDREAAEFRRARRESGVPGGGADPGEEDVGNSGAYRAGGSSMIDERQDSIKQGINAPEESEIGQRAAEERRRRASEGPEIGGGMGGTSDESSPGEEAHENAQRQAQEETKLRRVK